MALDIQLSSEHIDNVKVWPAKVDFGLIRYLDEADDERQLVIDRLNQLSPTIRVKDDGKLRKKLKQKQQN